VTVKIKNLHRSLGLEQVRARVEQSGATHEALAHALDVDRARVTRILNGRAKPTIEQIVFFKKTFGVECEAWIEPPAATSGMCLPNTDDEEVLSDNKITAHPKKHRAA
jgi:plasmid maintenance system antidote protein VapI